MHPLNPLHFGTTYSLSRLVAHRVPRDLAGALNSDTRPWSAASHNPVVFNPFLTALTNNNDESLWLQAYLRTGYFYPAPARQASVTSAQQALGNGGNRVNRLLQTLTPHTAPSHSMTPMAIFHGLQDNIVTMIDGLKARSGAIYPNQQDLESAFRDGLTDLQQKTRTATPDNLATALQMTDQFSQQIYQFATSSGPVNPSLSEIDRIRKHLRTLKAMNDFPMLIADDMVRGHYHYLAPEALRHAQLHARWRTVETPEGRQPVADVIVIGLGPGGIAGATAAKNFGANVVAFDAAYAMRAFSDAGACGIHTIRTNSTTTNMFQEAVEPRGRDAAIEVNRLRTHRLPGMIHGFLLDGDRASRSYTGLTGKTFPEPLFSYTPNSSLPITRSALAQYGDELIDRLALPDRQRAFVVEQAPIQTIHKREDGLIEVTSANGHRQLGKNLLMATGMTGSYGENAKVPGLFESLGRHSNYLLLRNGAHLAENNTKLEQAYQSRLPHSSAAQQQLIITDPLMGDPRIQRYLSDCKPGTRCLVVGSGESAGKAVLEVLRHNPRAVVDFVCKGPIETAQIQVPENNPITEVIQKGLTNKLFAKKLFRQWKHEFGTPITPNTYKKLLEEQEDGRVRIYEMDTHVTSDTVTLVPELTIANGRSTQKTRLFLRSPETARHIMERQDALRDMGLWNPAAGPAQSASGLWHLPDRYDGPIILATGYDHKKKQDSTLARQLLEQNLATKDPDTGEVVTKKGSGVWITGMCGIQGAVDSTIFGNTSRAIHSVGEMLGVRTTPITAKVQRAPVLTNLHRAIGRLPQSQGNSPLELAALKAYPWDAQNIRHLFRQMLAAPHLLTPIDIATLVSREHNRLRMIGKRAVLKAVPKEYRPRYTQFMATHLPEMVQTTWRDYLPF